MTQDPYHVAEARLRALGMAEYAEQLETMAAGDPERLRWLADAPAPDIWRWLAEALGEWGRQYHGHCNYATWAAVSWLTNDPDTYAWARGVLAASGAEGLRDAVAEKDPLGADASLYADLLTWALRRVNWHDVAEAIEPEAES